MDAEGEEAENLPSAPQELDPVSVHDPQAVALIYPDPKN
jgi:hypothetical protein